MVNQNLSRLPGEEFFRRRPLRRNTSERRASFFGELAGIARPTRLAIGRSNLRLQTPDQTRRRQQRDCRKKGSERLFSVKTLLGSRAYSDWLLGLRPRTDLIFVVSFACLALLSLKLLD